MISVPPNPYSPFADADAHLRHLFAVPQLLTLVGAPPVPGQLASTACGRLAVVPADVIEIKPGTPAPAGACLICFRAMEQGQPRELATHPKACTVCGTPSRHGLLCALCRQEGHDAWWASIKVGAADA